MENVAEHLITSDFVAFYCGLSSIKCTSPLSSISTLKNIIRNNYHVDSEVTPLLWCSNSASISKLRILKFICICPLVRTWLFTVWSTMANNSVPILKSVTCNTTIITIKFLIENFKCMLSLFLTCLFDRLFPYCVLLTSQILRSSSFASSVEKVLRIKWDYVLRSISQYPAYRKYSINNASLRCSSLGYSITTSSSFPNNFW